jgi:hypothetical protein
MGKKRNKYKILVGKPEEKRPLRRPNVGGRIILRWMLEKYDGGYGLDRCGSGKGPIVKTVMNLQVP